MQRDSRNQIIPPIVRKEVSRDEVSSKTLEFIVNIMKSEKLEEK